MLKLLRIYHFRISDNPDWHFVTSQQTVYVHLPLDASLVQSHDEQGLSHAERIDMASSAETVIIKYINVGGVVKIELNKELSKFFEFVICYYQALRRIIMIF